MNGSEARENGRPGRLFFLLLLGRIALGIVELFFLAFGIYLLILSYHLTDPFSFIMTFFASNLVILISAVLLLGLVLKVMREYRTACDSGSETQEAESLTETTKSEARNPEVEKKSNVQQSNAQC